MSEQTHDDPHDSSAAADERERAVLLDIAAGAAATGLAALLLSAVRVESGLGLTLRTGTQRLAVVVPVLGLVALVLCVAARCVRRVTVLAAGLAGVAALTAVACSFGALRAPSGAYTGPGGWLSVGGFACAGVVALFAALRWARRG